MNTDDLKKVLYVANNGNLQVSSKALNVTAGALSKTLKRVEEQLGCQLFTRQGKVLKLNQQGQVFLDSGAKLIQELEQFSSQFMNSNSLPEIRISAPSILSSHLGPLLMDCITYPQPLKFQSQYEESAAKQVMSGAAELALITGEMQTQLPNDFKSILLIRSQFQLACGDYFHSQLNYPQLLSHEQTQSLPFVVPSVSPFCGKDKPFGTDGWPTDKFPRRVAYKSEDYLTLLSLVKSDKAVAYLPNFIIKQQSLKTLKTDFLGSDYTEDIYLVWRPSQSESWLNKFVHSIEKHFVGEVFR